MRASGELPSPGLCRAARRADETSAVAVIVTLPAPAPEYGITDNLHRVPHVDFWHFSRRRQDHDAPLSRTRNSRHAVTHPNRPKHPSEVIEQRHVALVAVGE